MHDAADALPPEAFVSACILPGVLLLCRRRAWGQRICSDETTAFRWSGHNRAATRKQGIQNRAWAGRALPQPPLPPGPAGTINARKSLSFTSISETETNFSCKDPDSCIAKLQLHVPEANSSSYHQDWMTLCKVDQQTAVQQSVQNSSPSCKQCSVSLPLKFRSLHPPRLCRIAVISIKPTFPLILCITVRVALSYGHFG